VQCHSGARRALRRAQGLRDTVRLPNFQALGRLRIGETVEEVLKADLALEGDAIPLLRDVSLPLLDVSLG